MEYVVLQASAAEIELELNTAKKNYKLDIIGISSDSNGKVIVIFTKTAKHPYTNTVATYEEYSIWCPNLSSDGTKIINDSRAATFIGRCKGTNFLDACERFAKASTQFKVSYANGYYKGRKLCPDEASATSINQDTLTNILYGSKDEHRR